MQVPVLVPEQDGGVSFAGRAILSASKWIPLEKVHNKEALLRASCITGYSNTEPVVIQLAVEEKFHIRLPRFLTVAAVSRFIRYESITDDTQWEKVVFNDLVVPRDAKQEAAWASFASAENGILNIACGGGKTTVSLKKIAQRGCPAIVFVNNSSLLDQWVARAQQFLGLARADIGIVQQDTQEWEKPLVIAMLQTVVARKKDITLETKLRFGTVIFDEVHRTSAETFLQVVGMFYGIRYGLTATVKRVDRLEAAYLAHLGPVFYSDDTSELYADVIFKETACIPVPTKNFHRSDGLMIISRVYALLSASLARNTLIVEDVVAAMLAGRKPLLLSHSVEHLEVLAALLRRALPGKAVGIVHGSVKTTLRTSIFNTSDVVVASFAIAKEGLDVPSLDTLFLVTPFRDPGAFQQCRGRIERTYPGKQHPLVIIYDDVNVEPAHRLCSGLRRAVRERDKKRKDN